MSRGFDEKVILKLLAEGSELAYRQVWQKYFRSVYKYARRYLRSHIEADEVTQEVFLRLWINRQHLTRVENFDAYFFVIKRNVLMNYLNKVVPVTPLEEREVIMYESPYNADTNVLVSQLGEQYNLAVESMPPQRNKVYRLAKEQELSYDEIADELGISKNAVKKHLKIAFKFMKDRLRHLGPAIFFLAIWHLFK